MNRVARRGYALPAPAEVRRCGPWWTVVCLVCGNETVASLRLSAALADNDWHARFEVEQEDGRPSEPCLRYIGRSDFGSTP